MMSLVESSLMLRRIFCSCRQFHSSSLQFFSQQQKKAPHNLGDPGPLSALLRSRSVIRFHGPDTVKFLQGLLTNDVHRFGDPPEEQTAAVGTPNLPSETTRPVYAAVLTPQGRFLYDLFLYRPPPAKGRLNRSGSGPGTDPNDTPTLFADVDASELEELIKCFNKYRLRSKVEIDDVSEEFACWQRFGGNLCCNGTETEEPEGQSIGWGAGVDHSGISATQGTTNGWQWFRDPRLSSLGFRGIFPSNDIPPLVESDKEADEELYLLWRIEKGVAEGSKEIPKGDAIPLEYNLAGLNAISFDKGCYVGQESVARTHHRGVIRKRLLPLQFVHDDGREMDHDVNPGSEVVDAASKKAGTVTVARGCRGMGVLRLQEAFREPRRLSIRGHESIRIDAFRPDWWPSDWITVVDS